MNTTVLCGVFIAIILFGVFVIIPTYIYCSHIDRINHDRYTILDDTTPSTSSNLSV